LLDEYPVHNEALAGDTLYSIQLNYRWRELLAAAMTHFFLSDRSELSLDNQDLLDDFLLDLYDAENVGSLMKPNFRLKDLLSNKTTNSTIMTPVAGSNVAFTPTKRNFFVVCHNIALSNTGAQINEAEVRFNADTGYENCKAQGTGNPRPLSAAAYFPDVVIGEEHDINLYFRTSSGTVTMQQGSSLLYEIVEYD